MPESTDDVVLNIYELLAPPPPSPSSPQEEEQQPTSSPSSTSSFFSFGTNDDAPPSPPPPPAVSTLLTNILTPLGFGAYHTSLTVRGSTYTYGSMIGIRRTLLCSLPSSSSTDSDGNNTPDDERYLPPNSRFIQSIYLGKCKLDRPGVNRVVERLRLKYFTGGNYHLAYRNCNHFTEVFSTALILADSLRDGSADHSSNSDEERQQQQQQQQQGQVISLDTYPGWVNRLARTGVALLGNNCDDVGNSGAVGCDVLFEAREAVGADERIGWHISKVGNDEEVRTSTQCLSLPISLTKSKKKKVLNEAQRAALAKLKANR